MARAPQTVEVEEALEADRLEGFPHPRETRRLFGHDAAERTLAETFAAGRMHHGWLIAGRRGIGKATLAYRLARHALAKPEERSATSLDIPDEAIASRQVQALSHPGLLVIRRSYDPRTKRFSASIPVDAVRRLRSFLSHSADAGTWRVVIVDEADELNVNAANALLKSLEEPPPNTAFLLITAEPGRLLPTIRSRCRILELAPLGRDDLQAAAAQAIAAAEGEEPAPEEWQKLIASAQGSVRRLLGLRAARGLELSERTQKIVAALPEVDWAAAHALGDEIGSVAAEQRFELFFELLLDYLARLIRAEATGEGTAEDVATAHRVIGRGRLATFAELWETVVREKAEALALNLDRKQLVLETLSRLETAARR